MKVKKFCSNFLLLSGGTCGEEDITTEKGGRFSNMIIWMKENGSDQRILEVVYEKSKHEVVREAIDQAREKWVKLCNLHNTKNLVEELYTEDAIYYNRGRILRGHTELTQEYSYMQQSSYTLQLHPKHVEIISETIAFEIGQCNGSYHLPYMLVWKKESGGNWRVYLDSNY